MSVIIGSVIIVAGLLMPTLLLPTESAGYTGLSTFEATALFIVTVVVSLIVIAIVSKFVREWRNFAVSSVIGAAVGSAIIAIVVWAYSQVFFSAGGYIKAPIQSAFIPIIFVWTFATEIPFILLIGPPIIKACYNAYPSLRLFQKTEKRAK
jgi:hypothetical protein